MKINKEWWLVINWKELQSRKSDAFRKDAIIAFIYRLIVHFQLIILDFRKGQRILPFVFLFLLYFSVWLFKSLVLKEKILSWFLVQWWLSLHVFILLVWHHVRASSILIRYLFLLSVLFTIIYILALLKTLLLSFFNVIHSLVIFSPTRVNSLKTLFINILLRRHPSNWRGTDAF